MAELARTASRSLSKDIARTREFLVFVLAGEQYGIELTRIREILSPPPITPVPRAGKDVLGVCSVRGLLVTVFDLRRLMNLVEAPAGRRTRVLLARTPHGEIVGLLVDEVKHVVRLNEAEMEVATTVLGGDVSEHVMGIGRPEAEEVLVLLDLDSMVVSHKEARQW